MTRKSTNRAISANDPAKLRRLLAEAERAIDARDRIIAAMGPKARGAKVPAQQFDARQIEIPVSAYPLTEFAMGQGLAIPLPASLEDIAEVIGREAAVKLAEGLRPVSGNSGRTEQTGNRAWRKMVYVPQRMELNHPIVKILGWNTACQLQRSHTNMILEIAFCADIVRAYRNHVIRLLADHGETVQDIAAQVHLHPRSINTILGGDDGA